MLPPVGPALQRAVVTRDSMLVTRDLRVVDLTKQHLSLFARSAQKPGELNPPLIGFFGVNANGANVVEILPEYAAFEAKAAAYVRKNILARLPADPWPEMNRFYNLGPRWLRRLPYPLSRFIRSFDTSRSKDMYWHDHSGMSEHAAAAERARIYKTG